MLNNKLTASLICMDMGDVKTYVDACLDIGVNHFHADFMDNTFVPRLGISPELIQFLKKRYKSNISIDSHLMVRDPIQCMDVIAPYSDWYFIHMESMDDPVRALQALKKKYQYTNAGVVFNLATSITTRFESMGLVDGYMFMGISPGVLGTNTYPNVVIEKINILKNLSSKNKEIFVDGGVGFKSVSNLLKAGADMLVCGSSTLFKSSEVTEGLNVADKIKYNYNTLVENLEYNE